MLQAEVDATSFDFAQILFQPMQTEKQLSTRK
jgi:hypothetical protein